MKKQLIYFTFIIIIAFLITGCLFKNDNNKDIIMYELQTHEYFNYLHNIQNKYYIDSEKELDIFYSLFSDAIKIDKNYFKENTVFVHVIEVGSGSDRIKLKDVNFKNNTVNFSTKVDITEVGTADMACWYLVAIIPNSKLDGISYEGWSKPSSIDINEYK